MNRFVSLCAIPFCLLVTTPAAVADDQFFDSDGVKIRYIDRGPRDGEPVVLIHGGFSSAEGGWEQTGVIDALDDRYRVIAPDLRGHGKSDKPHDPNQYGNAFVEDIVRLLDHLGIDQAHVVGYSMGGRIVFQLVADRPERVISAMPNGTDGEGFSEAGLAMAERTATSLEESGSIRPVIERFNQDGSLTEEQVEQIVDAVRASNDTMAFAAMVRRFSEFRPDRSKLEANEVPCMTVIGELDPNREALDVTTRYMPNLEVEIIEGRNHMTAFQDPRFVGAIKRFLDRHSGSGSWSRFRGPHGAGVVPGDALPTELGLSNLAWKTTAPPGQSSPIVVGDAIVLTGADDDAFIIVSYDATSGREQWRHTVARERRTEIYADNDAASPTPATDGKAIYAFFPDFGLVAVSADGEELWRHPLPAFRNHYGMASSPVLAKGLVLLLLDAQDRSLVLGVDRETGEKRWSSNRTREVSWTTPLVLDSPGGQVLLTSGALWLDAYNAATGEELWSWFGVGHDALASPVHHDGTLYVLQGGNFGVPDYDSLLSLDKDGDGALSAPELIDHQFLGPHAGSFDQNGDGLVAREEWDGFLEGNSSGTHGLAALDLPDLSKPPVGVRWRHEMGGAIVPGPTVVGDVVFAVRNGGIVASFDRQSGELLLRERLPEAKGRYFASPVGDQGKLYFASEGGKVSVVATDAEWSVLAVSDLGSAISSTPAIRGSQVFVRTRDALMAFRAE